MCKGLQGTARLRDAVKEIEKGNFGMRVKIKTEDEIGELSKSFNYMAQTIESLPFVKG